jgi:FAD:protein FMN transferase
LSFNSGTVLRLLSVVAVTLVAYIVATRTPSRDAADASAMHRSGSAEGWVDLRGRAFGTDYHIQWKENGWANARGIESGVKRIFDDLDQRISIYNPRSDVSLFNAYRTPGPFSLDTDTASIYEFAEQFADDTGHAFEPTIAPLIRAWGFGPYKRRSTPPDDGAIAEARSHVGAGKIERSGDSILSKLDPLAELDLSAMGEGLAIRRIAVLLRANGLNDWYVELGGEICANGKNARGGAWRVGVERPERGSNKLWCVVELDGVGIASSGAYQNFFEAGGKRYSHILDPRTGRPVEHNLVLVSVIHRDSMVADVWGTALMVLGPEAGMAIAREKKLAALFIIAGEDGFHERATPEFERYRVHEME